MINPKPDISFMPDGRETMDIRVFSSLSALPAAEWDACAGTDDPFVSHGFLSALEQSGAVAPETGWAPRHLGVFDGTGQLAACAPLYLKSHSHGEYVFDWGWADAYARAGGRYYPKLQCAVPFTPATGKRLLVPDSSANRTMIAEALIDGMVNLATKAGVSSFHITFPTESQWTLMGAKGLLKRVGEQFHWKNRGYRSFDDFLSDLACRKRKAIKKERRSVADSGLVIRRFRGKEITETHWDAFFHFYLDTASKKWGHAYLNREFFSLMHRYLGDRVLLVLAEDTSRDGDSLVGGALNLIGGDTLYGRYWGCVEDYKFLHFECCYYQAIDFAIDQRLAWVEAGAQGPHKIQRGYLPRPTYSAHWIRDAGFSRAVENFVAQERADVEREIGTLLSRHNPFKSGLLNNDPDIQKLFRKV